jgi:hypothetical protein
MAGKITFANRHLYKLSKQQILALTFSRILEGLDHETLEIKDTAMNIFV